MNRAGLGAWGSFQAYRAGARRLVGELWSLAPALLFGLRLWIAVCLALYIAFWLQLDNAYWAGTSAAAVFQPSLGASLRKAWFRVIGTAVGAVAIVLLTACFPQDRTGFLLGLAIWGAACALVATLLRNFASYAAVLAGLTAAIIASDELGAIGGASGDVFNLAVARASEICIGILCAGVVLIATDVGGARHRLAVQFAGISAALAEKLVGTLLLAGAEHLQTRTIRLELFRRAIALDPMIDETLGESSDLRPHSPALQAAIGGLFVALSGWRTIAVQLELLTSDRARQEAAIVLENIPPKLRSIAAHGDTADWTINAVGWRRACTAAVRNLLSLPAETPSLQLLADQTAAAMISIRRALDGLVLLVDPARAVRGRRAARVRIPDLLPALINGVRAFVTIGAVALFWILTAWPGGAGAVAFAAIAVILFAPKADQAYPATMSYMVGIGLTVAFAAILKFAVLPGLTTFAGFALALALVLVPVGTLMARSPTPMLIAMAVVLVPMLAPANQMSYDTLQFYNSALAIVAGIGAGALAFRLLPAPSPALRTRRLLALTLRDLRRLAATGPLPLTIDDWEHRAYVRLSALPEQAEPSQRAQLLAALSMGVEIIRVRRLTHQFGGNAELNAALDAVAGGNSILAIERLGRLDRMLAALSISGRAARIRLRARGSILAMSEALANNAAYFDSGAAR
jgi:uncharacterized membrane protein YccC